MRSAAVSCASRANCLHHREKNFRAICAAELRIRGAIRMRHQTENIPFAVANPRDVLDRAIWICFGNDLALVVRVAQNHLFIGVQFTQRLRVSKNSPLRVPQAGAEVFLSDSRG